MNFDSLKKKLSEEKERIIGELDHYKKEDPYLSPSRSSQKTLDDEITETEGHDRIVATRMSLKESLAAVEGALKRIKDGTYGVCKNCGNKIPEERLAVMPTASLCVDCEEKLRRR